MSVNFVPCQSVTCRFCGRWGMSLQTHHTLGSLWSVCLVPVRMWYEGWNHSTVLH